MDFMKVLDQTVREIKREVNLKVLKVPEIEQKVLDATDNEPWGPHGTALAEIAQATRKFTECQLVMNVLWTRLAETGKDWRYVYKALAVIEYLISHGSERAVDDIIEHTFQISSLTSFEYMEPNGKDVGLNVRKKAETIVALLNNKEKIQEVRNKAAANRDKYVGLSSTGITFKSSPASFGSGSYQSSERYGGFGSSRDGERFGDSFKGGDQYREEKSDQENYGKSRRGVTNENQGYSSKKGSTNKAKDNVSSNATKSIPAPSSSVPSNTYDDDFDDFDPRGTSSNKPATANSDQVDLFGDSLIGDLLDAPAPAPTESSSVNGDSSNVDLFADATFVSAPSQGQTGESSETQKEVDLFASEPAIPTAAPSTVELFASSVQPETKASRSDSIDATIVDPFAAVPLNSFDGSDSFGAFTSHSGSVASESKPNPTNDGSSNLTGKSSTDSLQKKDAFQVKSGIWADSLSRGIIDLNISAPKKVSLVDVGVVGGLSDGSEEKEKGRPTSLYMGKAMGTGSGLGKSGFTSSQATDIDDFFSSLGSQQHQFGSFQK